MASSSSAADIVNPLIGNVITEKLNKTNHALWKAQVLAVVRGARLEDHLTGASKTPSATTKEKQGEKEVDVPNPLYGNWIVVD